ncbi:hypothetical protein H0H92_003157 [Tricholoma furcatifolium]|nr:hypothetical protein H0H92_003157 [Tricholoma furcatifolium]
MFSAPRSSPRDPPNDQGQAGTPVTSRPLPTRAELKATLSGDSGLIKSADDARRWMETKGWILTAEPYDRSKLVRVLMTTATIGKGHDFKGDVQNAVLAVAFLLEDNVKDVISTSLADKLTSKVMSQVEEATSRLSSAADFASATDTARAESTISLKSVADQLQAVSANLDKVSQTLSTVTARPSPAPAATWANIVKNTTPPVSAVFDPLATDQQTRAQQRAVQMSKTVLVALDPDTSPLAKDRSPATMSQLRTKLNDALQDLNTEYDLFSVDQEPTEARTHIRGLSIIRNGSLLLEFDTPSSAERFKSYTSEPTCTLLSTHLGVEAKIKTRPCVLIVRFVPIASFDPSDSYHI